MLSCPPAWSSAAPTTSGLRGTSKLTVLPGGGGRGVGVKVEMNKGMEGGDVNLQDCFMNANKA